MNSRPKMKFPLLCVFVIAAGRCASQCPGQSIDHSISGRCHVSENCMSATCHMSTATHPSPSADSVTLKLNPCSTPIQLTISGDLYLQDGGIGVLPDIQVGGPTQVPINQGGLIAGLLQVTKWNVTDSTLHFGMEVHLIGSDASPPLFNVTLTYNRTQHCTVEVDSHHNDTSGDSSLEETDISTPDAPIPTVSPSSSPLQPLTTCEALQVLARSNSMCEMGPNTCQALECIVEDYRIGVTIIPCGEKPGVMITVDHLLEERTVLRRVYTDTSKEAVYLGETRLLFDMVVSIHQSLNMDHITLMLELIFPRGRVNRHSVVVPAVNVPVNRSSCSVSYTNLDKPGRISPAATTSEQPDIPSNLQEQPTGVGASVPAAFKIVLASVVVTAVLLVAVVVVVICSIVVHRKLDKYYAKLDKRLIAL